jgi:LmbE family N-acetylglucosaminyl deacetylase
MRTLVVAPHPDDELLGVGGTLFRRKHEGSTLAWLIMTGISSDYGWRPEAVKKRAEEISQVKDVFGFDSVFELNYPTTKLDQIPRNELVESVSEVLRNFLPHEVFLPHPSDVHSDHRVTFEVVASCTKWFRFPSIKKVLAYETLSETGFGLDSSNLFRPNVFINIESYLQNKLNTMNIYSSETGDFPFPRSSEAISSLAKMRGAASGYKAAEAFELLREID